MKRKKGRSATEARRTGTKIKVKSKKIKGGKGLYLLSFIFYLLSFHTFSWSYANTGGTAGAFLQLGGGARACGMGGAFVAVADDVHSLYWNPGGLNRLTRPELVAFYRLLSLDRTSRFLGYAQPLEPGGGYALGWLYAGTKVDQRDINGEITGRMSDSEHAFYFAFGRGLPLPIPASLGLTMKYLYQDLANQRAKGLGFDLGLQLQPLKNLRIGCVVQDMGTHLSWQTTLWERETSSQDDIPSSLVMGASYRTLAGRLLMAADASKSRGMEMDVRLGSEFVVHPMLSVRGGVSHLSEAEMRSVAAGFDLRVFVSPGFFRFGYAYITDPIGAGDSHIVSVTMGF